ncbi:MAG: hypothetical protein HOB54_05340 [Flavobacteriales bacterium]|jgi:hypothetical protein|nr:hypothetical protein [Flavobacteriales bacterium]MBT5273632.1 hypothetical protein [Flavobacteriales bacterium]MBT5615044.1 hypothetical protein [Flavobacteriales bacterium]MBT6650772.1 hypothetical protein [Flavobacteriales bacterium]MBT6965278.1 hypothetical protein [Flavobacteriales bacterium]
MLKIKSLFLVILMTCFNSLSFGQCAMCKAVVEANLESGDTKGAGLNDGILFLMSMPYIAVFLFGVFYYLQKKKTKEA